MQKFIKNHWQSLPEKSYEMASILQHNVHPEGLDVERIRFLKSGRFVPNINSGHIISIVQGNATLHLTANSGHPLYLKAGIHLYLPPGLESFIDAEPGTGLLRVSTSSPAQIQGKDFLLRDECFLKGCASHSQSLRWIFTAQYLSRRIFLSHDQTLLSQSGFPLSWFHTTMFDVDGLPHNEDQEPVFKMSYNSQTEFNVCYDVTGIARVRMAQHPYPHTQQSWGPWVLLDDETTYCLHEIAGGPEEEQYFDPTTQTFRTLRNKHEVSIVNGHVSLFCLFDPGLSGIEKHRPGEYSDYTALSEIVKTAAYQSYRQELARYDSMIDQLSLAKARGELHLLKKTSLWECYLHGLEAQKAIETHYINTLAENNNRKHIFERWQQLHNDMQC